MIPSLRSSVLKEAGFPGFKLHPDYQDFFVDEERMLPIYEAVFNEGLVIPKEVDKQLEEVEEQTNYIIRSTGHHLSGSRLRKYESEVEKIKKCSRR